MSLPRLLWVDERKPHLTYQRKRAGCQLYIRIAPTETTRFDEPKDLCATCGGTGTTLDFCGSCVSTCKDCKGSGRKP